MSKFPAFIQNKIQKQRLNRKPNFWSKFFNIRFLNIAVLVMVCFVGLLYLAKINDMATKGFKMKELDERQTELRENLKRMELRVSELQSMQQLEERIANLNMVTVAKTEYVSSISSMAVK